MRFCRGLVGNFAVVTRRDGRGFAGKVEAMDVCTGEVTIRAAPAAERANYPVTRPPRPRTGTLSSRHKDHQPSRRTRPGGRTPPAAESDHGLWPGAFWSCLSGRGSCGSGGPGPVAALVVLRFGTADGGRPSDRG